MLSESGQRRTRSARYRDRDDMDWRWRPDNGTAWSTIPTEEE